MYVYLWKLLFVSKSLSEIISLEWSYILYDVENYVFWLIIEW